MYGLGPESLATAAAYWWLGVGTAVPAVAGMCAEDHLLAEWDEGRHIGAAIVFPLATVAVGGALVVTTDLAAPTPAGVGLGCLGAGVLGYRPVYGVVLPVPAARLEAGSKRAV